MPSLEIVTNFEISKEIQKKIALALSAEFSKISGKPEKFFTVAIITNQVICWGGDFDKPLALCTFSTIGGIEGNQQAFTESVTSHLKEFVPADRIYLTLHDVPGKNWGWNNTTFKNL